MDSKIRDVRDWDILYVDEMMGKLNILTDRELIEFARGVLLLGYGEPELCRD